MKIGDSVVCDSLVERMKLCDALHFRGAGVRTEPAGGAKYRVWRTA